MSTTNISLFQKSQNWNCVGGAITFYVHYYYHGSSSDYQGTVTFNCTYGMTFGQLADIPLTSDTGSGGFPSGTSYGYGRPYYINKSASAIDWVSTGNIGDNRPLFSYTRYTYSSSTTTSSRSGNVILSYNYRDGRMTYSDYPENGHTYWAEDCYN